MESSIHKIQVNNPNKAQGPSEKVKLNKNEGSSEKVKPTKKITTIHEEPDDYDNWLDQKEDRDHKLLPMIDKEKLAGVELSEASSVSLNLDDCK